MNDSHKKGTFITSNRIVAFASILAVIIAAGSFYLSDKSLDIANKSIELANRPYLTVRPIKFKDTDSYLKIIADYNKPSLSLKAKFEMINLGKTPAKNVLCPQKADDILPSLKKSENQKKEIPFQYFPCPKSDLGPGETLVINIDTVVTKGSPKSVQADLDWYNSGKGFITLEIPIKYSSILDSSKEYFTMVSWKIYKEESKFVKSEIK